MFATKLYHICRANIIYFIENSGHLLSLNLHFSTKIDICLTNRRVSTKKESGTAYLPTISITTYSDLQPVLNRIAQSEIPEVTIKFVFSRFS